MTGVQTCALPISDMFVGDFSSKRNSEVNEMRKNLMDISEIPSAIDDKENLRNDLNSFFKDTLKAQEEIKATFKYGKTK